MLKDETVVCIYRDEKMGCKLGAKKPMECEAWPFSVSRLAVSENGNLELLLVLEHSCPPLNKSECLGDIKKFALENVADKLFEYSLKNLETLRECDKRNIVIESRSISAGRFTPAPDKPAKIGS
ncbi:hypothetical protein AGMMS49938_18900 [Fibrobacterales bacterium]|nr:hypothetical protein AGMMS49938_18900 [Fibrobacterales bacterium]